MTKEYFIDLFGRYVQYLIVSDSIGIVMGPIFMFVGYKVIQKALYWYDPKSYDNFPQVFLGGAGLAVAIVGFIVVLEKTHDLVQDFYIPEIRIYEKLNPPKTS